MEEVGAVADDTLQVPLDPRARRAPVGTHTQRRVSCRKPLAVHFIRPPSVVGPALRCPQPACHDRHSTPTGTVLSSDAVCVQRMCDGRYGTLRIARFALSLVLVVHWLGCGFFLVVTVQPLQEHDWLRQRYVLRAVEGEPHAAIPRVPP